MECVLLNCCFSEPQAEALNKHIPYVIGMSSSITDEAACTFSIGFYKALGAGRSYQDAFAFGCNSIRIHDIPEHATPVLLAKPELVQKQSGTTQPETASKQGLDNIPEENWEAYQIFSEKLGIFRRQYAIETDQAEKLKLRYQIEEAKEEMKKLMEW